MKKFFCFSDIHGNYKAFVDALDRAGYEPFNPNHQLLGLGDYFGRADDTVLGQGGSMAIYRYLTSPDHFNVPICLRGNHESILYNAMEVQRLSYNDIYNGEHRTVASFHNCDADDARYNMPLAVYEMAAIGVEQWIEQMPWYYETTKYIFTHGFLPQGYMEQNLSKFTAGEWHEATWCHTVEELIKDRFCELTDKRKTVVLGHFGTDRLRRDLEDSHNKDNHAIWFSEEYNVIGLDATTILSQEVNVFVVEDDKQ